MCPGVIANHQTGFSVTQPPRPATRPTKMDATRVLLHIYIQQSCFIQPSGHQPVGGGGWGVASNTLDDGPWLLP